MIVVQRERIVPIPLDVVWQLIEPAGVLAAGPLALPRQRLSREGRGRLLLADAHWDRAHPEADVTVMLESVGPGTRVVLESRHEPSNAIAGVLLRFTAKRRIARAFDRALGRLASASR